MITLSEAMKKGSSNSHLPKFKKIRFVADKGMIFIVTSDEPWGKMMHTQLHYALELSRKHTVYFIDPPQQWPPSARSIFKRPEKISQNFFLLPYFNLLPVVKALPVTIRINDYINFFRIKNTVKKKPDEKVILWRFDPQRMLHIRFCTFDGVIYHVVDDYRGKEANRYLLQGSDLVVTTSPRNREYFSEMHPHVYCIPQAISNEELMHDEDASLKVSHQYGSFVLFTGTLSNSNDYELILHLVTHFRQFNFLFIGPVILNDSNKKLFDKILSCTNVHYLGTKDGKSLKNYIHASSACIIPYHFARKKQGDIRSPLKALHYLAQFKPVITSIDCELDELEGKAIYMADNRETFVRLLEDCLEKRNPYDKEAVKNYLDKARYDKFINQILALLADVKTKRNG